MLIHLQKCWRGHNVFMPHIAELDKYPTSYSSVSLLSLSLPHCLPCFAPYLSIYPLLLRKHGPCFPVNDKPHKDLCIVYWSKSVFIHSFTLIFTGCFNLIKSVEELQPFIAGCKVKEFSPAAMHGCYKSMERIHTNIGKTSETSQGHKPKLRTKSRNLDTYNLKMYLISSPGQRSYMAV